MKTIIAGILVVALASTSCKKNEVSKKPALANDAVENIVIHLNSGESYKYTLPVGTENASIETDAKNASFSRLSLVPGVDSLNTYEYVPTIGFTGTDAVTIAITPAGAEGCHPHPQGNGANWGGQNCGNGKGLENGHPPKGHPKKGHCGYDSASVKGKHIVLRFNILSSH